MSTQRQRLVFFNATKTEMVTASTKAMGRNAEGAMTYEDPATTWGRIIDRNLIDLQQVHVLWY